MRSYTESGTEPAIIDPSFRPPAAKPVSAARRRFGIASFSVGSLAILLSDFLPSIAQWLLIPGSILIVLSLFLLGTSYLSRKDHDIRKLYGR